MLPFEIKMEIGRVKKLLQDSDASIIRAVEDIITNLVDHKILDGKAIHNVVYKNIKLRKEYRKKLIELHQNLEKES